MNHEQKTKVKLFVDRVRKMRVLQTKAEESKHAGDVGSAKSHYADSRHYAVLIDATIAEVTNIISANEQTILEL